MSRLRPRAWIVGLPLASAVGVVACSGLLGFDEVVFRGGDPDGGSAQDVVLPDTTSPLVEASTDAGAADGSADARADVTVNLTPEGDFEAATTGGCASGWVIRDGDMRASPIARTGVQSCRICIANGKPAAFVDSPLYASLPAEYRLEAFAHTAPGFPVPNAVVMVLRSRAPDGGAHSASAVGAVNPNVDAGWTRFVVSNIPQPGDDSIQFNIEIAGDGGACALIDDLSLTYTW